MDSLRPQRVSVIDPIAPAVEHVKTMLFRPFGLMKWLIVGFCAWLAYLGQGGGGGPSFNYNFGGNEKSPEFSAVGHSVTEYLPFIIIGVIIIIPIFIIIGLVLSWLRSRGKFMFVHCIAGNKAQIAVPWEKFARHGNSLFIFKIVLSLITLAVITIPVIFALFAAIAFSMDGFTAVGVLSVIGAVFFSVIVAIVAGLITKFTDDFVVPIMFLQTESCLAGWKTFLSLIGRNKASMALYIIFQIVIYMVIGVIAKLICLVACCLCCCTLVLFCLPYVGTVILLPLIVFERSYSLFYLRQLGPQFDVFSQTAVYPQSEVFAPKL